MPLRFSTLDPPYHNNGMDPHNTPPAPFVNTQVKRRLLNDGWTVTEVRAPDASPSTVLPALPATVPGHVHLDLVRAGVIGDPFYRMNERGAGWVDEADWAYETTFTVDGPPPPCAYLVFHGLDTVAEISLNGELLGRTDSMFVPHEFAVGGRLKQGENTLRVVFQSALRAGRERRAAWAEAGNEGMAPDWFMWGARSFVRKAQYMYGWDWGPEPVSCGVWKDVELVTVPIARLLDWRYDTAFNEDGTATVTIEATVERSPGQEDTPLTLKALCRGFRHLGIPRKQGQGVLETETVVETGPGRKHIQFSWVMEDPSRWEIVGRAGAKPNSRPPLYDLQMYVFTEGAMVASRGGYFGLRTVELVREPDADGNGESFRFRINGEDVFIKGANWIPSDSFPSRGILSDSDEGLRPEDRRVTRLLVRAQAAGVNMLRVWGGGLYESEHFYSLCDRLGILVWQDFPYACAYYPDGGTYAEAAREEAVKAVRRIRNHPSLALWCGNNENSMMQFHRWAGENTPPRLLGERLYNDVLPAVVAQEDPATPYWPSSPFGGDDPNSEDFGDRHDWDVWHGIGDWTNYRADNSRFVSEFGFASSCGLAAWDSCLAEEDKHPHSAAVRWHDKTRKGYDTYLGFIALHFPAPQTLPDLVYYSQINQAEALKCGVEHWRRKKGRCWGTLFWQWNDCWPVQSWSVIDYAGEPKAAYYAAKRFYASLLLSLVVKGDAVEAHLTNDHLEEVAGEVTVSIVTFEGETLAAKTIAVQVGPNGTALIGSLPLEAARGHERDAFVLARFTAANATAPAAENVLLLAEPKDLRLADPGLIINVNDGRVTLTAQRFAPYVWIRLTGLPNGAIPTWDDNFFHLLPGESKTVSPSGLYSRGLERMSDAELRARLTVQTL